MSVDYVFAVLLVVFVSVLFYELIQCQQVSKRNNVPSVTIDSPRENFNNVFGSTHRTTKMSEYARLRSQAKE